MKNHVNFKWLIILSCCSVFLLHAGYGLAGCPEIPASILSGLNDVIGKQGQIKEKIASALLGVGKNLVLENTRGSKEVAAYKKAAASVVFVMTNKGFGSGSIIDGEGHVITNWHVVENFAQAVVIFKPKGSAELKKELAFVAKVIKVDKARDLALLKINMRPKKLPHFQLGASSALSVGMDVNAIGHPKGQVWTYTKGFISQIRPGYTWTTEDGVAHKAEVIQTQTPINPGSSGGPLFDNQGRLIGINSFRFPGEALNYAVAVNEIKAFLRREKKQKVNVAQPSDKLQCREVYSTNEQGWNNIYGCYLKNRNPPPDFWIVYRKPNKLAYIAVDSKSAGHIDTIVVGEKEEGGSLWYFMDTDCDGIVDLIGHQYPGKNEIGSFKRPSKKIHIFMLAKKLRLALRRKIIPYPTLKVCQ